MQKYRRYIPLASAGSEQATAPAHPLLSGFLLGVGALALLGSPSFKPERYKGNTVSQSWKAVGNYIGASIRSEK